jgi:hypothetical protein
MLAEACAAPAHEPAPAPEAPATHQAVVPAGVTAAFAGVVKQAPTRSASPPPASNVMMQAPDAFSRTVPAYLKVVASLDEASAKNAKSCKKLRKALTSIMDDKDSRTAMIAFNTEFSRLSPGAQRTVDHGPDLAAAIHRVEAITDRTSDACGRDPKQLQQASLKLVGFVAAGTPSRFL